MSVTAVWSGGLIAEAYDKASGHRLVGDEPDALGGQNLGPNPFSLLKMSLANCTVVTAVGEVEFRDIAMKGLEVAVHHKQNKLVGRPRDPEQRELRMTGLRRSIRVTGDFDQDQLDRLLWAAEHCPVSNSLEGTIPIETSIELVDEL